MNLYKLSVILQDSTIERGVWADDMIVSEGCYTFRNMGDNQYDMVAYYPVDRTFIYSIETEAQVEERKSNQKEKERSLTNHIGAQR
jgi:hypothetical protein